VWSENWETKVKRIVHADIYRTNGYGKKGC
jgi:hypothetical protein